MVQLVAVPLNVHYTIRSPLTPAAMKDRDLMSRAAELANEWCAYESVAANDEYAHIVWGKSIERTHATKRGLNTKYVLMKSRGVNWRQRPEFC